jgi:hypothetical protein
MSVRLADDGTIWLVGDCSAQDADPLLQYLLGRADAAIDWSTCDAAHTAVIQVVLASGRKPIGQPRGTFLKTLISPVFNRLHDKRRG